MEKIRPEAVEELTVAFRTEMVGHAFYKHASELVSNEKGKNIFKHLAKEELEHMAVVLAVAESLKKGRGWMSYRDALSAGGDLREKKGLPIFPEENELIERLRENPTDQNAVSISIESEEKAVHFYGDMLKAAATADEKVVLTDLLEMEKGHLKILRWEYESLRKTGFWGEFMEYSVEKESD
ncbi:MAG: ferritin family protein [Deltaproteobacteria bacterium]|nr:ferritin family protein [Deltaproteobacteria bacterium]